MKRDGAFTLAFIKGGCDCTTIDARPLTTQATGSRLRSREACCCCCMLHVDLPGQWEGTERHRARWKGRGVASTIRLPELDVVVATTACFAQLCLALPCEGLGKNSTESHGSALPSSLQVSLSHGTHSATVAAVASSSRIEDADDSDSDVLPLHPVAAVMGMQRVPYAMPPNEKDLYLVFESPVHGLEKDWD